MKRTIGMAFAGLLLIVPMAIPQGPGRVAPGVQRSRGFDAAADAALAAMRMRAGQMNVSGVAVIAYFEGEPISAWTSKMVVVGKLKTEPTGSDKGSNLLGIAYAKASEMAETLKDSGTAGRPPLTGEFGWNGGVIEKVGAGHALAAFSGGKSEDDVAISREGLARLKAEL